MDLPQNKIPLAVVVGPTASGKTRLAIELCKRLSGEVISGDSMQLYKQMTIATAKPTAAEQAEVPHHLIDLIEPWESFSVARYTKLAHETATEIYSRGLMPVIAGGTGLYIRSLIDNITFANEKQDMLYRKELRDLAASEGCQAVHDKLREVDSESADNIHPNNLVRVMRALEIYHTTGCTISSQRKKSHDIPSPYRYCIIGVGCRDKQRLDDRINQRVDMMMREGLLEEARAILSLPLSKTASQAIGYKEFIPYFDGKLSLEAAVESVKLRSRQYAKRQMTWFRREGDINWLWTEDFISQEALADAAYKLVKDRLQK